MHSPADARRSITSYKQQASIISYIDDFKLMMILSLAAIPLVLLLRSAPLAGGDDHAMVME